MKIEPPTPTKELLTENPADVVIRVGRAPYVAFGQWLEGELKKLEARWISKAAPCASKGRR